MTWLAMSELGVMTAATMKITRMAYLNCRAIHRALTTPIRARKNTSAGIWKMAAIPSSIRM